MARARILGTLVRTATIVCVLLAAPMVAVSSAQDRPGSAVEFAAGWVGFADDGVVSEGVAGAPLASICFLASASDLNSSTWADRTTVTWW